MIDRQSMGLLPAKPHTAFRAPDGSLLYEEMFTRAGFDGPFTYFYHRYAPTPALKVESSTRGWAKPECENEGLHPLKRRLYDANVSWGQNAGGSGMLVDQRKPILFNADITIWLANPSQTDDLYFANNDGDEVWFVRSGSGRLESFCGWLDFKEGDYVFVPRSMVHRWHLNGKAEMLGIEARKDIGIPAGYRSPVGQLTMASPYTHRDFVHSKGPIATLDKDIEGPALLLVKKNDAFTQLTLERSPMDVIGWDGFAYPFVFPIKKFSPKIGQVHLPPTVHATFLGPTYVVCSFVPRMVDFHEQAIPCPYPHSNVNFDEVLLYLDGNFTSRKGVGPGSISLHPSGVVHGPHPGAYERSIGTTRTEELAVMIDTVGTLYPTKWAVGIENAAYHDSWKTMG